MSKRRRAKIRKTHQIIVRLAVVAAFEVFALKDSQMVYGKEQDRGQTYLY